MKSLTKAVILSFMACILFTIVVIVLTCIGIEVPDTLITMFFTTFGVEFAATAAIKIAKSRISRQEKDEVLKDLKKNNLPVEKADITKETEDYEYYG